MAMVHPNGDTFARRVGSLHVVFRSCTRVAAVHGNRRRVVSAGKADLTVRCLWSVVRSISDAAREIGLGDGVTCRLTVVDDHSDAASLERIGAVLGRVPGGVETRIVGIRTTGLRASMRNGFELGRARPADLIYFVEDDYLHADVAIAELVRSFEIIASVLDRDVVMHPFDDPLKYNQDFHPCHVVAGATRHWRTINRTTLTFALPPAVLEAYWSNYVAATDYDPARGITEDETINPIYKDVPCFSPIPSLALHLQYRHTLSPFVDWEEWWRTVGDPDGSAA